MADDSSSRSASVEGLAEMRSLLSQAIAQAVRSRAHLVEQRQQLKEKHDAAVRAGQSHAVDSAVLIADSERVLADLRRTVQECTRQLKRQHVPPATVLTVMKTVASSAAQGELALRDRQSLVS